MDSDIARNLFCYILPRQIMILLFHQYTFKIVHINH